VKEQPPEPSPGPVRRAVTPVVEFLHDEAAGGAVLLAATLIALGWANSPASSGYQRLWHTPLTLGSGPLAITDDLTHWINDAAMVLFFFVVGLEIKRELAVGELRTPRAAALPVLAALGGVLLPAGLFLALTAGTPAATGWGIPMATDIAFAVGVLAVLGRRIPAGARLLLLSVAIVDDIIAVLVIAAAYSHGLSWAWLAAAVAGIGVVVAMRLAGVDAVPAYLLVGLFVWYATFHSGVHATIAGVVLGLLTPARPVNGRHILDDLQHTLHPISAFLVIPLFALANAGIDVRGGLLGDALTSRTTWAVIAGLLAGKTLGIAGAALAAHRLHLGVLPPDLPTRAVCGIAALGGIGFTVSLFITDLAYTAPTLLGHAKIGILTGSTLAALTGATMLLAPRHRPAEDHGEPAR
jgi:NhaA family Na+:H+ antiporter